MKMMRKIRHLCLFLLIGVVLLAACTDGAQEPTVAIPTSTLAPLVSLTPRVTATPFITRTPRPTFTPIPPTPTDTRTPTISPTPTVTPPVVGIIGGMESINVREGPGTNFAVIRALPPGTTIMVLFQNPEGDWFNIKMEDGEQGWVWANPIYIENTATPIPSMTPSPDMTAVALGTPLPTALIGGGTVTPTPPRSIVTATPIGTPPPTSVESTSNPAIPTESFLPIIDIGAINMTATALAAGLIQISPPPPLPTTAIPPTRTATPVIPTLAPTALRNVTSTTAPLASPGVQVTATGSTAPVIPTMSGDAITQDGVDVFAMCDDPSHGIPAPGDLAAGSTIDIYWAWFVSDPSYMQQHINAVNYEVRINDLLLTGWRNNTSEVKREGNLYVKYWYLHVGPLAAGNYAITYRATWNERITDGIGFYGPGSVNLVEEGSCNFVVR